ncbi:polysaccharide pyruvyl transferase family protein [Desulfosporosinus sp. FKA]|uniref:polysaccharide pyruvyl transferase family protein n=1 Tax=Desulfosporosinus sp. FKA TaxID=1969834 RepID=UPI000B4A0F7A|nr:polysaccharide pyruvyl transferase family protein [Desulfosporosinus sp. FKA]
MKYGILTYHNIPNFGAVLQAFALCEIIRGLGADCELVDYQCENIINKELTFHPSKNPAKALFSRLMIWPKMQKKISGCEEFVRPLYSTEKYDKYNISKANEVYDAFISGSDMIWNLDVNGQDYTYFQDFSIENKVGFSYGSSIGAEWSADKKEEICSFLQKYKLLSTREQDTCLFIENEYGLKCECVVDPTMLFTPEQWDKYTKPIEAKNYVFVYFPYPEILIAAKKYAQRHGKKVIVIGFKTTKGTCNKALYSPAEWMSYIKSADAIFTDSYHGLLFSLYFEKKVWTNNQGNRIISLLEKLGLKDCLIQRDPDFENKINYFECYEHINKMREESMFFLSKAIRLTSVMR